MQARMEPYRIMNSYHGNEKKPESVNGTESTVSEQTGFALSLPCIPFFLYPMFRCFHTPVRNDRTSCVLTHPPPPVFRVMTLTFGYTSVKIFLFMFTQFCELF